MNCPSCRRPIPAGNQFCGSCGAELRQPATIPTTATATAIAAAASERPPEAPWHPSVAGWAPASSPPPPTRRRFGPGLLAAVMGVLLLFGGVGLFAVRTVTARAGAGSPEAAASGLLTALDRQDLGRAAGYLSGEERQLVDLYGERLVAAVAGRKRGAGSGNPLAVADLTARDLRFRQVAGAGDVAVLELTGGTIGVTQPGGVELKLPVEEAKRRLAEQSKGGLAFPRLVTLRSDGRWYVSLSASAAEWARLSGKAGQVDYAGLTGSAAGQGASSPEAAVRGLADALGTGTLAAVWERLLPEERRVAEVYSQPLLDRLRLSSPDARPDQWPPKVRIQDLTLRSESVADGVTKVVVTGGTAAAGPGEKPSPLSQPGSNEPVPAVVVLRRDGAWYPSLLFSAVDAMLSQAESGRTSP